MPAGCERGGTRKGSQATCVCEHMHSCNCALKFLLESSDAIQIPVAESLAEGERMPQISSSHSQSPI